MKTGQSLNDLMGEVERVERSKRDFLVQSSKILFDAEHNLVEFGNEPSYVMTDVFHDQVAGRLDIPRAYYNRMREESPALLDKNVRHWLTKSEDRRMVRTLAWIEPSNDAMTGRFARAFLSDRYRPLDNYDLMATVLPVIHDKGLTLESCQLTEKRLYLKVVSPTIEFEVRKGDVVRAGLVISNSEIGSGTLSVEPLIYRLVCLNGMVASDNSLRKYHVGRGAADFEGSVEFYRDETRQADDRALWLKVRDTVAGSLELINFQNIVNKMQIAANITQSQMTPVSEVIEVTRKHLGWTETESEGVKIRYAEGNDRTLYGLINAITRHSQDVADYVRATEFERMGGRLLDAPAGEVKRLGFNA